MERQEDGKIGRYKIRKIGKQKDKKLDSSEDKNMGRQETGKQEDRKNNMQVRYSKCYTMTMKKT